MAACVTALAALGLASIASATTQITVPTPTGFFDSNINGCSGTDSHSVQGNLGLPGPWAGASSGDDNLSVPLTDGTMTVNFDQVGQQNGQLVFHWVSNLPIDLAIVKQANGGAYWSYSPAQTEGYLGAYKPDGKPSDGISHVIFCYKPGLVVTKTAATAKKTTYDWTVVKTADPTSHQLNDKDSVGTSNYLLDVTKSAGVDSAWSVSGVITVKNASTVDTLVTLSDMMSGGIAGTITTPACTGSFLLLHGATIECSYTAALPDGTTRTNTATADAVSESVGDGRGTAEANFANATVTKINDVVTLTDTYGSQSWQISSSSDDKRYSREFTCGESQIYPNTAKILGDNPETVGVETMHVLSRDGATVTVICDKGSVPLLVEKTATGSFTRTHTWTVVKSVDKSALTLEDGASGSVLWTIGLNEVVVDSNFMVSGTIKVSNANGFAVEGVDVTDSMEGATIDCDPAEGDQSTGLTIPANGYVVCSYSVSVEGATAGDKGGENTATAIVNDKEKSDVAGDSDTAVWSFDEPTEVDAVVDVKDTNGRVFADVSDTEQFPISYSQQFTCGADKGKHTNTATVYRDNTDVALSTSSADTTVTCNEKPKEPPVTPPTTPPTAVPPVVTPPVLTPPVLTPPVLTPPTVKPKPKPVVKPAICAIISIEQKSIAAGKKSTVTVTLTAGGKAVAGAKVRFKGAGVNKVVRANSAGVATTSITASQAGIITVSLVGKKACNTQRLGVIGTFEPPVTG